MRLAGPEHEAIPQRRHLAPATSDQVPVTRSSVLCELAALHLAIVHREQPPAHAAVEAGVNGPEVAHEKVPRVALEGDGRKIARRRCRIRRRSRSDPPPSFEACGRMSHENGVFPGPPAERPSRHVRGRGRRATSRGGRPSGIRRRRNATMSRSRGGCRRSRRNRNRRRAMT